MKCLHCGSENEESSRFCTSYGAPLATPAPLPAQVFCQSCGAPNSGTSQFCSRCGSSLAHHASHLHHTAKKQQTSWAWWLMPTCIGWIRGLIAWLAVKRDDEVKARHMLWLGIGLTIFGVIIVFVISGIAYFYAGY